MWQGLVGAPSIPRGALVLYPGKTHPAKKEATARDKQIADRGEHKLVTLFYFLVSIWRTFWNHLGKISDSSERVLEFFRWVFGILPLEILPAFGNSFCMFFQRGVPGFRWVTSRRFRNLPRQIWNSSDEDLKFFRSTFLILPARILEPPGEPIWAQKAS